MLALLLPFVGQAFPYGVPLYFPAVVAACGLALLCAMWRGGMWSVRLGASGFPVVLAVSVLCFLYGLLLTDSLDASLLSETLSGVAAAILWLGLVNRPLDPPELAALTKRFMNLLLAVAVVLAVLGFVKFALFLQGEKLAFVEERASGAYPWGTSLTTDYNMYALTMLGGALAATVWTVEADTLFKRVLAVLLLLSLVAAGFLSGSRRFWVVAPVACALAFVSASRQVGARSALRGIVMLVFVIGMTMVLVYRFGPDNWDELVTTGWNLQARLDSLMNLGEGGGVASRVDRWDFAFSLLSDWRILTGQGFDYLEVFACHFGTCQSGEYPHNPLISAFLYAGVAGLLSVSAFFGYMGVSAVRNLLCARGNPFIGSLLLAHLPITFISSNGPFAVKSLLVMAVLAALCDENRASSGQGQSRRGRLGVRRTLGQISSVGRA